MSDVINDECEEMQIQMPAQQATPIVSVKNHLYLYSEITEVISRALFSAMHELAMQIIENAVENNTEIIPIYLHICSPGGSAEQGLAIVQVIKDIQNGTIHKVAGMPIKVPVNTIMEGEVDSAATVIAIVGNHRSISKYALSLIHPVRQIGNLGGKAKDVKVQAENLELFQKRYEEIYMKHSKITKEQLDKLMEDEKYSTPEELLSYGFVDEILDM